MIGGRIDPEDEELLDDLALNNSEVVRRSVKMFLRNFREEYVALEQRKKQLEGDLQDLKAERQTIDQKIQHKEAELSDIKNRQTQAPDKLEQEVRALLESEGDVDPHTEQVNPDNPAIKKMAQNAGVDPEEAFERYREAYDLHTRGAES